MTIEPTHARGNTTRRLITIAWVLWAVQLVVAVFAYATMFWAQFSVASCAGFACDYDAFTAIMDIFNLGLVVLLLASALGVVVLRHHPRIAVWCPVIGIVLTATFLIASYALSRAALDLPIFGNRPGA